MTKQDYEILKEAADVLERLTKEDGNNEMLPKYYRKALIEAEDHYSMLMFAIQREEEAVVVAGFWNDELRQVVEGEQFTKDKQRPYVISWQQEINQEYQLTITTGDLDEDEADDLVGHYPNYICEDHIKEDLKLLQDQGFKIIKESGEPFLL